ncbi:relaxase/mobilization nuclease domain-containing protein [Vibrio scophthalmi]|uniref:relaxase/mobilization nuclease domain-containing protein n=1 Tax=Vibrio scophthalmi TaxID=45658 RepID=UPI003EB84DEF
MIFEELKCKKDKQSTHDITRLVRYGAKQSDDITDLVSYASSQSKQQTDTSSFICANEIASVPLSALSTDAKRINWNYVIRELQSAHLTNINTKQPFRHFVVSLAEGEQLPRSQWRKVTNKLMTSLGYQNARYIAFKHSDTDNEHIHIIASTTDLFTGKIISNWQSHINAQPIMRKLEGELGLQQVTSSVTHYSTYGRNEQGKKEQTIKRMMKRKVEQALKTLPPSASLTQFTIALLNEGIEIKLIENSAGTHFKGLVYQFHNYRFSASSLRSCNKYTLGKLVSNGLLHENVLDKNLCFSEHSLKAHNECIRDARKKFRATRKASQKMANQFRKQIKDHHQDQFKFMVLVCLRKHANAMQAQTDYWFYHSKFLRNEWERAIARSLYESEKGIYKAANLLSDIFYHILLTLFEKSLKNKWKLRVVVTNENHRELKLGKRNDHSGLTR